MAKHHECGEQKEYDRARGKLMTEFGMAILRIANADVNDNNRDNMLMTIEQNLLLSPSTLH